MQVCTAVTESHLPWVRVLAASFAEHHPEAPPAAVLVVDDEDGTVGSEPFRVLRPADVGIDRAELHLRGAMYRPMELAGSTRAALLYAMLADTGGEPVLFLDADVYVTGPLEPLAEQARAAGVVLSPHLNAPPPEPLPIERELLRAGAHNAGYVAVAGKAGRRFSAWWAGHLARDCVNAPEQGLFVSQRWLDLAPSLFDVAMLRDPGANVTPHNLGARRVERAGAAWTIDGRPLRFLHVSGGFDPRAERWPDLSTEPAVTALCREYADRLLAAGHRSPPQPAYAFATTADGLPLEPWVRAACREAVLAGESFPDPFEDGPGFTAWLAEPVAPPVTRWALALRDWRPDLRALFPQIPGADGPRLLRWLSQQADHAVPDALRPPPVDVPDPAAEAYADLRRHYDAALAELERLRAGRPGLLRRRRR